MEKAGEEERREEVAFLLDESDSKDQQFATAEKPHVPNGSNDAGSSGLEMSHAYQDLPWAFLFGICMLATVVVVAVSVPHIPPASDLDDQKDIHVDLNDGDLNKIALVAVVTFFAAALSAAVWAFLIKTYSRSLIWIALGVNVAWVLVLTAAALANGGDSVAFFSMIYLAILGFWIYIVRRRIPMAASMLEASATAMKRFPNILVPAYGSVPVLGAFMLVVGIGMAGLTGFKDNVTVQALGLFLVFSWYWGAQVVKNVVHVTSAGTFGTYYLAMNQGMPPNPTLASFKRATTTSFGSVCLGSLFIAIIQFLRFFANAARGNDRRSFIACIAECLLQLVERVFRYINVYAFTQVALYGKSYCTAAQDTANLLRAQGIDMLINDDLSGFVLGMATMASALTCAAVGAVSAFLAFGKEGLPQIAICAVIGLLMGLGVTVIMVEVIASGIATLFVVFALNPEELRRNMPELHDTLQVAYGPTNIGIFQTSARPSV